MRPKNQIRQLERDYIEILDTMDRQQVEISRNLVTAQALPRDWLTLHHKTPTERAKCKLTVSLDADMVAWYRGLGRGYQKRINAILRGYMLAITSNAIKQGDDKDWLGRPI